MMALIAARTGGLVNYASLGRDLLLNQGTARAHLELLRQLFLVFRLRPWSTNLGARQVKTPKFFVADSGLAASLVGVDAGRYSAPDGGEVAGQILETLVVMELVKQATWSQTPVRLYFYRDSEKREVDVVIESASGDVAAVEVKASAGIGRSGGRGLRHLRDRLGSRFKCGVIVYTGEHTLPFSDRIWAVPVSGLWQRPPAPVPGT